VQIFIPSVTRAGEPIPLGQHYWMTLCLEVMGRCFGGATAFPPALGVWLDPDSNHLVYDETVLVFSYAGEAALTAAAGEELREFINRLGLEGRQGEVGMFVDGTYYGFQTFEAPTNDEE
jgi:hypothetical protein